VRATLPLLPKAVRAELPPACVPGKHPAARSKDSTTVEAGHATDVRQARGNATRSSRSTRKVGNARQVGCHRQRQWNVLVRRLFDMTTSCPIQRAKYDLLVGDE
jgi:hypothetical protein